MIICNYNYELDTRTGELTRGELRGVILMTGDPMKLSVTPEGDLMVHYEDHRDCFKIDSPFIITPMSMGSPTYLFTGGNTEYHRFGNDLWGSCIRILSFFEKCEQLFWAEDRHRIHGPHIIPFYIDTDGKVHGSNTKVHNSGKYKVIYDCCLCIYDTETKDYCVIYHPDRPRIYGQLIAMPIDHIEIHLDACRIYTGNTSYHLTNSGLWESNTPLIGSSKPQVKSARAQTSSLFESATPPLAKLSIPEIAKIITG